MRARYVQLYEFKKYTASASPGLLISHNFALLVNKAMADTYLNEHASDKAALNAALADAVQHLPSVGADEGHDLSQDGACI